MGGKVSDLYHLVTNLVLLQGLGPNLFAIFALLQHGAFCLIVELQFARSTEVSSRLITEHAHTAIHIVGVAYVGISYWSSVSASKSVMGCDEAGGCVKRCGCCDKAGGSVFISCSNSSTVT